MNNRVIKFRAWNKDFGEMVYANVMHIFSQSNYEKMQFTGLLDKNGVEVFEGDIIKRYHPGIKYWMYGAITWDEIEAKFRYVADFKDGGAMSSGLGHYLNKEAVDKDIEVVGNIYTHKHLLK